MQIVGMMLNLFSHFQYVIKTNAANRYHTGPVLLSGTLLKDLGISPKICRLKIRHTGEEMGENLGKKTE